MRKQFNVEKAKQIFFGFSYLPSTTTSHLLFLSRESGCTVELALSKPSRRVIDAHQLNLIIEFSKIGQ
jgi:hypothetical protein